MKKAMALALSVLLTGTIAIAQDGQTVMATQLENQGNAGKFTLSLEPIWLVVSGIGIGAHYNLTSRSAIDLKFMGIFDHVMNEEEDNNTFTEEEEYKASRQEVNLGMTFMLFGDFANHGMYLSPSLGYVKAEITDYGTEDLQGEAETGTARITTGYRWALNNGLNFRVGGGFMFTEGDYEVTVRDRNGNAIATEDADGGLTSIALDAAISYTF